MHTTMSTVATVAIRLLRSTAATTAGFGSSAGVAEATGSHWENIPGGAGAAGGGGARALLRGGVVSLEVARVLLLCERAPELPLHPNPLPPRLHRILSHHLARGRRARRVRRAPRGRESITNKSNFCVDKSFEISHHLTSHFLAYTSQFFSPQI